MIIEALLEQSIIDALQSELGDDVQLVGSRLQTKVEDSDKKTIVAVASAFRNHDAFSLSLINVPVAISVATRVEGDAQSQEHNATVEKIVDILVGWHKDGEAMEEALSNRKFLAGELRMDGGTTQTYDREHMCWTDAININIRGAEKFIKPTVVINLDDTRREFEIAGTIEDGWISDPWNVKEVSIGDEVTAIGERSFTGFGQMTSIVVPKNVTSIGYEAFSWTGLTNVVIENGVTELGNGVFSYSYSLSSITLPSTLTNIGGDVFEECRSLASVSIPKSVVNISPVAFRYSRLTELTMVGRTKAEVRAMENFNWGL